MKIALVGPAYPLRGGIAAFDHAYAQALHEAGHEVVIFSYSLQYPNWLFPGKSQYDESPKHFDFPIFSCINSIWPYNWWRVARRLRDFNPDSAVLRYWTPFLAACLGSIVRWSGLDCWQAIVDNALPHESQPLQVSLIKYALARMQRITVLSEQVERQLHEIDAGWNIVRTFHPLYTHFGTSVGREAARTQLGLPLEGKILLFFGLIRPYKGLDLLIEAMALLPNPPLLLIAGEPYMSVSPYQELAKRLGVADRIIWHLRFIADQQVPLYFCAADCLVQPYRSASQSGVTPVAYHFDLPTLVTAVGGLAEAVEEGKTGWIVQPQPHALAQGIQRAVSAPSLTESIRYYKKKLSWAKFVEQTL